ncbi:MAG: NifB/NifX family molybdenum-iron cluster-binding protein [Promethearchaeota archaeon]
MKKVIGIPANGPELTDTISPHFGHCNYFVGVEINDNKIVKKAFSIQNDGHSSCMEPVLRMKENNVTDMIVGGIGGRPYIGMMQVGINLHQGAEGTIKENVELFLEGKLKSLGAPSCGDHSQAEHQY